jgi:hypothetical protein
VIARRGATRFDAARGKKTGSPVTVTANTYRQARTDRFR